MTEQTKYTVQTSRGPVRFHSVGEPIVEMTAEVKVPTIKRPTTGNETRAHLIAAHHFDPARANAPWMTDQKATEKHVDSHCSMAISTPERAAEGRHHR